MPYRNIEKMKTSLSHLPEEKQIQLDEARKLVTKKIPNASKIILYGSYALGNWVQDKKSIDGLEYEYVSDYDLLIVVPALDDKEYVLEDKVVNGWKFPTYLAPDVRSIEYVNAELKKGNYFFEEILKDGVILFDDGKTAFVESAPKSGQERQEFARVYFDKCMDNAEQFEKAAKIAISNLKFSIATFMLHQAAENYYSAVLLVLTGYKPKVHNLKLLRDRTKEFSESLYFLFKPHENNPSESRLFSLLKRGYVEARYHATFEITKPEILELSRRVSRMRTLVIEICTPRLQRSRI